MNILGYSLGYIYIYNGWEYIHVYMCIYIYPGYRILILINRNIRFNIDIDF